MYTGLRVHLISDSQDSLAEDMTAGDNLVAADHMPAAVRDTAEWDIRDILAAVVVHIRAVEDSSDNLDIHQGLAGNSCRDCSLLALEVR